MTVNPGFNLDDRSVCVMIPHRLSLGSNSAIFIKR